MFGFVPARVIDDVRDTVDWKSRALAVEELRRLVNDLTDGSLLAPFAAAFVEFVGGVCRDPNVKTVATALGVIEATLRVTGLAAEKSLRSILDLVLDVPLPPPPP
jgi:hypothetical protein